VILAITLVTIIAAIGSQANRESESPTITAPITRVSQSVEGSFSLDSAKPERHYRESDAFLNHQPANAHRLMVSDRF
jgi:hypothetical protein